MACFVVAVTKALASEPPAGVHEGARIVPLGAVPGAFSGKILLPNFILLHQKFGDGCGVLDDAVLFVVVSLPLLSPSPLLVIVHWGRGGGGGSEILGRGFDEIRGKGHIEGLVHGHLEDFVETNKAVVDHQAVLNFFAFPEPTLDLDFHGIKKCVGRLLLAAMRPLKMIFSVRISKDNNFTPMTRALPVPNKMEVMLE